MGKRGAFSLRVLTLLAALWPAAGLATPQPAPSGGPIAQFARHDPDSTQTVRHALWSKILDAVVTPGTQGRRDIDYGNLNATGHEVLNSYLAVMQGIEVSTLNRREQLAYWLNLYNAQSFNLMLEEFSKVGNRPADLAQRNPYRSRSIRVKKVYLDDDSPWARPTLTVEGVRLSLNDIEHRILYAHWDPAMAMYGLFCPARSCPALQPIPFEGERVETQLGDAAREFIARKDSVDIDGSKVELSELYRWHAVYLGGEAGVIAHLRQMADPAVQAKLAGVAQIKRYEFSWKLNGEQPPEDWNLGKGMMNRGAGAPPYY